jgi:hypothetical protein
MEKWSSLFTEWRENEVERIQAHFEVVKVDDKTWDVIILAEADVLQAFAEVYTNLFYVEESVFDRKPAIIAPDFPNQLHAAAWKSYWVRAFEDPDNACETCATVKQLLGLIEKARQKRP